MFAVTSFSPQIERIHAELMRSAGVGGEGSGYVEEQVVNGEEVARVESLGAMGLILTGASALLGEGGFMWMKAEHYRQRYERALQRGRVRVDADGDGESDVTLYFKFAQLVRG